MAENPSTAPRPSGQRNLQHTTAPPTSAPAGSPSPQVMLASSVPSDPAPSTASPTPTSGPVQSAKASVSQTVSHPAKKSNTGAIVGGVVGGVVGLALLLGLAFLLYRRRRSHRRAQPIDNDQDHLAALEKTRTTTPASQIGRSLASEMGRPGAGSPLAAAAALEYHKESESTVPVATEEVREMPPEEIDGREVDSDGVSVRSPSPTGSRDMESRAGRESEVPRFPMYTRGEGGDGRSSSRAL